MTPGLVIWTAAAVAAVVLALRSPSSAAAGVRSPPWWQPALLVLGCAALAATISGGHLDGGVVDTSDFEDYCAGAAWWRTDGGDVVPWPRRRARLASLPAGLLSWPLGILDGLGAAGVLGFAAVALGVYLAGAALVGPAAGGAAAVVAVALAPLAVLTRHLSFYPTITGTFALSAGLVVRAAVTGRRGAWVLGCLGVAACPLVDLRGMVWGGALGLAMLLSALRQDRGFRLGVLAAAVAGSWLLGLWSYPENAASLEEQAWQAVHLQQLAAQQARGGGGALPAFETWTVWGRSPPRQLLAGLRTVAGIADTAPARDAAYAMAPGQLRAWTLPLLLGGGLTVWRLRLRPWALATLAIASAPFLLAWADAVRFGQAELRQVALGAPAVALLIGCGLGALSRSGRWWLLPAALVVGVLPGGPLGPSAPWRTPSPSRQQHLIAPPLRRALHGHPPGARLGAACVEALMADQARDRGTSAYGDLMGSLPAPPRSPPAGAGHPARPETSSGR